MTNTETSLVQTRNFMRVRLILMNFLQFAVWGAYLISMGNFLANAGFATNIGKFYSVQGIVSIFMPALMGMVADKWIPAQKLLGLCHLIAGLFMIGAAYYAFTTPQMEFGTLFLLYSVSVAFYMPTIALSNSAAFTALLSVGMDTTRDFPPIRVFGTVGFLCTMWSVDFLGFQSNANQWYLSGCLSLLLALYTLTLPNCPTKPKKEGERLVETLGLDAFKLLGQKKMAIFFIFSLLLGVSLQITNAYANPYISSFAEIDAFKHSFGAEHANVLISISQISETCCILFIPFALKHFGIKKVMMIAMAGWVFRFGFFGGGDPGPGVWMFILSCVVYGVAFDFFNISGALYVDQNTDKNIRSSAQGLFMIMTNGLGATIGTLSAEQIVNHFVFSQEGALLQLEGWRTSWFIFAGYALLVLILFTLIFKEGKPSQAEEK